MSASIACPKCSSQLRVPPNFIGTAKCPTCKTPIVLPLPAPSQAKPMPDLVEEEEVLKGELAPEDDEGDQDEPDEHDRLPRRESEPELSVVVANPASLLLTILHILRTLLWGVAGVMFLVTRMNDYRATQNLQLIEYLYELVFIFGLTFAIDQMLANFGAMAREAGSARLPEAWPEAGTLTHKAKLSCSRTQDARRPHRSALYPPNAFATFIL